MKKKEKKTKLNNSRAGVQWPQCKTSVAPPSESVSVDESFGDLQHICINMEDKSTLKTLRLAAGC